MKTGFVYFIKNGEVKVEELTYNLNCTLEKKPFIGRSTIISLEEEKNGVLECDVMKIYRSYLDSGYSVVRIAPLFDISDEKIEVSDVCQMDIIVNQTIGLKDAFYLRNIVEDIESRNICDFYSSYLYNEHINMFGVLDYDYHATNQGRGIACSSVLPYFLNEKLGTLNTKEKIVVSAYRNFDLDRMLMDGTSKNYLLNNGNAGVIVVSDSKVYKSTVKKMQHGEEFDVILSQISKRGHLFSNSGFKEMIENPEFVFISLYLKNLVVWANTKDEMNDFQKEYLKNLAYHLKDLNQELTDKGDNELINVAYYSGGVKVIEEIIDTGSTVLDFVEFVDSDFDVNFKDKKIM